MSENNEYCISEEALQRLTEDIGKKMVESAEKTQSKSSSSCIYRVPKEIRKQKESAYTPRFVSIGPLHSKDQHILNSPVQHLKRSYANALFGRISSKEGGSEVEKLNKSKEVLMECVRKMRKSLDTAKKCYAEEAEDVLDVEMLVIDGCFILELLYKLTDKESDKRNDPIFGNSLMRIYVQHDLLLLENQLPFFVLNELFDLTVAHIVCTPTRTLGQYVISYFPQMWKSENDGTTTATTTTATNNNYDHILDILHNHYHHHDANPGDGGSSVVMPCASDLEYAGAMFKEGNKVEFCKPQSPFHRAQFKIPTLALDDSVEPFLRNLIAYEQCCPGVPGYFTSYAILMDTLINTPKDVQVLEKAGIIRNYLGASEDASDLFNNLCKGIVLGEFYFTETTKAAAYYSKSCWHDAMAHLRRRYFASPWTFIAFCVGFITFAISVVKFVRANFR
ncbi:UPF0481 protein At3g47200-like [Camellia sinensis]|uniref:UPF0481 protein At3g47200-like n=1 Tax=Camellia sinensis TaxID=4442 RepID=UPI001035C9B4|nr:UPF0481 protein At3g47200-like [Camellia sinensis]